MLVVQTDRDECCSDKLMLLLWPFTADAALLVLRIKPSYPASLPTCSQRNRAWWRKSATCCVCSVLPTQFSLCEVENEL